MDTVRHPAHHNLNGKWNLYYHLPNNTEWDLSSYSNIVTSIDTLETVISVNDKLTDNVVKNCHVICHARWYYTNVGRPTK